MKKERIPNRPRDVPKKKEAQKTYREEEFISQKGENTFSSPSQRYPSGTKEKREECYPQEKGKLWEQWQEEERIKKRRGKQHLFSEPKERPISETPKYDPLDQDMDNDGVIDRYDADFRDSNSSYRLIEEEKRYPPYPEEEKTQDLLFRGEPGWEEPVKTTLSTRKKQQNIQKHRHAPSTEEASFYGRPKPTHEEEMHFHGEQAKDSFFHKEPHFLSKRERMEERQDMGTWGEHIPISKKKPLFRARQNKETGKSFFNPTNTEEKPISGRERKIEGSLEERTMEDSFRRQSETPLFGEEKRKSVFKRKKEKESVRPKGEARTEPRPLAEKGRKNFDPAETFTRTKKKQKRKGEEKRKGKENIPFSSSEETTLLSKQKKKPPSRRGRKGEWSLASLTSQYLQKEKEENDGVASAYYTSRGVELLERKMRFHKRETLQESPKFLSGEAFKKRDPQILKGMEKKNRFFAEKQKRPASHAFSRWWQKRKYKKEWLKQQYGKSFKRKWPILTSWKENALDWVKSKGKQRLAILLGVLLMGFVFIQMGTQLGGLSSGLTGEVMAGSYLSKESVLREINDEFSSYEYALQSEMDSIKQNHPGYDEYRIQADPIGHEVHELFAYLTARYGEIKSAEEIREELKSLFQAMYQKEYYVETLIKRDEKGNPYTYRILNLKIRKKSVDSIAREVFRDYEINMAHYLALLENGGNMTGEFGTGDYDEIVDNPEFGNPGIAFDDASVRQLFAEAEKHIGKRYVFGASGPRNFDCSGFVCWSFNHSGVKKMPRTTAWLIYKQYCNPISPSEAKPGDIIFFKGTYNSGTPISHVGIYAGNNRMIHAGDPIQYTRIDTNYWKKHFYAFGRPR